MSILAAISNIGPDASAAFAVILMMAFWVAYIGFFLVMALTSLVISVLALVSLYRNRAKLRAIELAAWVGISLIITIVGPLSWFLIGRKKMLEDASAQEHPTPA